MSMDTLRLYLVTWNVATKSPGQDLNSLLDFPSQFNKSKPLPDFYVIGLQEVKSQPHNLLMDALFSDPWTSAINKILCRQDYIVAKSIRLQGILLLMYTQMKHLTHLRDIEAQFTKTGFGRLWGNKGAVSVRFNIYGISVSLVNTHMTAHDNMLAERINDYNVIINNHLYHIAETSNILYHDYVFWIGDLNFRNELPDSDKNPKSDEIVKMINTTEKDDFRELLKYDQLMHVRRTGDAFSEFSEPEIKFAPTYKFIIGGDDYDVKRKPSWTDRILYKIAAYENVVLNAECLSYNHIPHYTTSDHKPVVGVFNIKVAAPKSLHVNAPRASRSATKLSVSSFVRTDTRKESESQVPDAEEMGPLEAIEVDPGYEAKTVEFGQMDSIWYIGDADFKTQCTLSPNVETHPNDWIGIYDANFQNLDDYIAYEYLAKVSQSHSALQPGEARTISLCFPVGSGVRVPGFYRFIYFSQPNNDLRSVLGISEPFEASSKEDKLVLSTLDRPNYERPVRLKPTSASTDVFTDFASLDVENLSRHFSNDLSID